MWLSVLTQTIPWPPPGAGVALTSVDLFSVAGAGAGVFFGLNRLPKSGLAVGEAEGATAGAGEAFFRVRCSTGNGDAIGLAAGDGEASVFFRPRVFAGEAKASGLALGAGEVSAFLRPRVLAGEAEASGLAIAAGDVSAFLRPRVLAGDAEASGLVAGEVSAFFRPRFFAGDADASGLALGDSAGLCASTRETQAKMVINKSRARLVVIDGG